MFFRERYALRGSNCNSSFKVYRSIFRDTGKWGERVSSPSGIVNRCKSAHIKKFGLEITGQ